MTRGADFEPWVGECSFREGDGDRDYTCQVAVWANGPGMARDHLAAHLARTGHHLVWLEHVLSATQYVHRYGGQHKISALTQAVHPGALVKLGPAVASAPESAPAFATQEKAPSTFPKLKPANPPSPKRHTKYPVFSKKQFAQFSEISFNQFFKRLDKNLSENVPGFSAQSNKTRGEIITACITQARHYGFQNERSLAFWCHLALRLPENWRTQTKVAAVLDTQDHDEEERLHRLYKAVEVIKWDG